MAIGGVAPAAADVAAVRTITDTGVTLAVPADWVEVAMPVASPDDEPPLVALRHDGLGCAAAVVRADAPNSDAWRKKARDAYADEIEAGIKAAAPGYRREARTLQLVNEVPTLDLRFRRTVGGGREIVVMRLLLRRTYTLALTVAVPERKWRKARPAVQALVTSFVAPPTPVAADGAAASK